MTHTIAFTLNGTRIERAVDSRLHLADFLRNEIGARGTHIGCEHGVCGACTVLVNGEAVRSCLMLAVQADGQELTTVGRSDRRGPIVTAAEAAPPRSSMRLLHAGRAGHADLFPGPQPEPHARRDTHRAQRKSVPVHRIQRHGRCRDGRSGAFRRDWGLTPWA